MNNKTSIAVEDAWNARCKVHKVAVKNKAYKPCSRRKPPRLQRMNYERAKSFLKGLEDIFDVRLSEEDAKAMLGTDFSYSEERNKFEKITLSVSGLGKIADYIVSTYY